MRFNQNGAVLVLLIGVWGSVFSTAQQSKVAPIPATAKTANTPPNLLLAADDGLSVIAAALDARNYISSKADCSHLVHDVYERAGFIYTYVPSTDLYAGIAEFRRVTRPQPGDLIAWPGHVGIVVSPTRHTFYSSLNSGLGVESYDSDYWKQRGRPHFLRYMKEPSAVQTSNAKTPALKPTSLETTTSLRSSEINDEESSAPPDAPVKPASVQFPRLLVVESAKPTTEEVSEVVMNALSQTAEEARGKNIYGTPQTVVVVNQIRVERIKLKGLAGWADVVAIQSASFTGGQSSIKKHQEKQRWMLHRRDSQNWELVPPQGTIYLNQDDAVRLLAQQLAAMTAADSSNDAHQKAQLAALLGSLLQVKN